jgi:hypothetical protein
MPRRSPQGNAAKLAPAPSTTTCGAWFVLTFTSSGGRDGIVEFSTPLGPVAQHGSALRHTYLSEATLTDNRIAATACRGPWSLEDLYASALFCIIARVRRSGNGRLINADILSTNSGAHTNCTRRYRLKTDLWSSSVLCVCTNYDSMRKYSERASVFTRSRATVDNQLGGTE